MRQSRYCDVTISHVLTLFFLLQMYLKYKNVYKLQFSLNIVRFIKKYQTIMCKQLINHEKYDIIIIAVCDAVSFTN